MGKPKAPPTDPAAAAAWVALRKLLKRPRKPPGKSPRKPPSKSRSQLEQAFLDRWLHYHPHLEPIEQFVLPPWAEWAAAQRPRRPPMKADFAWPSSRVALEIEGGVWSKGRSGHSSGTGIERDIRKTNLAQAGGWILFRLSGSMMREREQELFTLLHRMISTRDEL